MANPPAPRFVWMTPGTSETGGAIGIVQIIGDPAQLESWAGRLGLRPLKIGEVALRRLPGGDTGLAAWISPSVIQLTPHAGPAVLRELDGALRACGLVASRPEDVPPPLLYPEAADLYEACMLDALARAPSPLAVSTLLAQPNSWRRPGTPEFTAAEARALERLLVPPVVAAVGFANVGKSSLVNALAGRSVAVVADSPGTTLDHVGVLLDLSGLVVQWVDTPGWQPDADRSPAASEACRIARDAIASADLIVACGDGDSGFLDTSRVGAQPAAPVLRVATRIDRVVGPADADVSTSSTTGAGLERLARRVVEILVPDGLRTAERRWRFHPALAHRENGPKQPMGDR